MSAADEKALAEARRLVDRGVLAPDEWQTIRRAGLVLLQNGRQLTAPDFQILKFCRGVWGAGWNEEPEEPAPTPFDSEIEETERALEEARAAHTAADDAVWQAAHEWALLTGQPNYRGFGSTMFGLLTIGADGVKQDSGGLPYRPLERPADRDAVAAAEAKIGQAIEGRKEQLTHLERLIPRLNSLKSEQSRWRMLTGRER